MGLVWVGPPAEQNSKSGRQIDGRSRSLQCWSMRRRRAMWKTDGGIPEFRESTRDILRDVLDYKATRRLGVRHCILPSPAAMPKGPNALNEDLNLLAACPRLLPTLQATFVDRPSFGYQLAKHLFRNTKRDFKLGPGYLEYWYEQYVGHTVTEDELERFNAAQFAYYYREVPLFDRLDYNLAWSRQAERCPYLNDPPVLVNGKEVKPLLYDVHRFASKLQPHEFWESFWKEQHNIRHPHLHEYHGSFSNRDFTEYYLIYAKSDYTFEQVLGSVGLSGLSPLPSDATPVMQWMLDLSSALTYLHGLGAFHRCIRPPAIVFLFTCPFLSFILNGPQHVQNMALLKSVIVFVFLHVGPISTPSAGFFSIFSLVTAVFRSLTTGPVPLTKLSIVVLCRPPVNNYPVSEAKVISCRLWRSFWRKHLNGHPTVVPLLSNFNAKLWASPSGKTYPV